MNTSRAASILGKLGKGIAKTLSPAAMRQRKRAAKMPRKRKLKIIAEKC